MLSTLLFITTFTLVAAFTLRGHTEVFSSPPGPRKRSRLEELEARTRELEEIPELELTTNAVVTMNQKTIDDIDRWLQVDRWLQEATEDPILSQQYALLQSFSIPHHQMGQVMQQKYSDRYCKRCAATLPKNDHLYCRFCSSAVVSSNSYYHDLADRMSGSRYHHDLAERISSEEW